MSKQDFFEAMGKYAAIDAKEFCERDVDGFVEYVHILDARTALLIHLDDNALLNEHKVIPIEPWDEWVEISSEEFKGAIVRYLVLEAEQGR